MIPKKSLDSVLDKSIILTITAPNDNAKSISVQCGGGGLEGPLATLNFDPKKYAHLKTKIFTLFY